MNAAGEDRMTVHVEERVLDGAHGPIYSAELSLAIAGGDRAVLDARSVEELRALLPDAIAAFRGTVSLRRRAR